MRLYRHKYYIYICTLFFLTSCEYHQDEDPTIDLFRSEGVPYSVTFTPELDGDLKKTILGSSKLLNLEINQPSSKGALLSRVMKDKKIFKHIFHQNGYFDAIIDFSIDERPDESKQKKNSEKTSYVTSDEVDLNRIYIDFKINPGQKYTFGGITIQTDESSDFNKKQTLRLTQDIIGIKVGEDVDLEMLDSAKKRIKSYFLEKGYPFIEICKPQGVLNKEKKMLFIVFPVSLKGYAIIAGNSIEGLKDIKEDFVRNRIPWKEGDPYNEKEIKKTQEKLITSNIISNIHVTPEIIETQDSQNSSSKKVLMHVKVSEAKPRIIGAGAKYSTSEGIGGRIFWDHNNLFGNGEHLGASIKSSKREERGKISFDIPDIGGPENVLSVQSIWLRERSRAYSGRTLTGGLSYDVPFKDIFHTSFGAINEASRLYAQNTFYNSHLYGFPCFFKIDSTDNILDPSQGLKIDIGVTPYWGKFGSQSGQLMRMLTNLQIYLPLLKNELEEGRFVLAGFAKMGTLFINDFSRTPPNKRFYGGGASSIRAYGYQMVGPLDTNNVPLGGRSITEWGAELRGRVTESIGIATFFEAALVTTKRSPEFSSNKTLYGAGFGVRYFSTFGPIRFDLAFPLTRRKNSLSGKKIDSLYQFYISVGQAF